MLATGWPYMKIGMYQHLNVYHSEAAGSFIGADLLIRENYPLYQNELNKQIKMAIHVGCSDTYDELLENVRPWLTGFQPKPVVYVMLVKITEEPEYHCPLSDISDEEFERRGLKTADAIFAQDFVKKGKYGPVSYQGDRWTGEIKEILWEIWKLNPETREPELVSGREFIIPEGNPQLRLHDCLSPSYASEQLSPDWKFYRTGLRFQIVDLAQRRYRVWQILREKKKMGATAE
ncbi:hypothetical protein CLAIMM_14720 [Cladophialophora immunda]|nr:hypothetical protein CLAIMM_14720 [Cladophialophora immunda]